MITMNPVESSNLKAIGYDEATHTLQVEFLTGATYQYADVPQQIYTDLMAAESKGSFLNNKVKGVFEYKKV